MKTEKTYLHYRYKAIATTPASEHVHCNRVKEGEFYNIGKTDSPNFVSISGKLYNKNMGFDNVYTRHIHISKVKDFVIRQES